VPHDDDDDDDYYYYYYIDGEEVQGAQLLSDAYLSALCWGLVLKHKIFFPS
jgi:hypothetical protein